MTIPCAHQRQSDLFHNLHYIFVVEDMIFSHSLRLMFHGRSPHKSAVNRKLFVENYLTTVVNRILNQLFEFFNDGPVKFVTEILHSAPVRLQDNRRVVIGQLSLRFCITKEEI